MTPASCSSFCGRHRYNLKLCSQYMWICGWLSIDAIVLRSCLLINLGPVHWLLGIKIMCSHQQCKACSNSNYTWHCPQQRRFTIGWLQNGLHEQNTLLWSHWQPHVCCSHHLSQHCLHGLTQLYLSSLKTQEKLTGKPSSDFFIILLALKLTHLHINEHHITYSDLWMLMAHHRDTVMPEAHPKYKVVIHLHSLGICHSWGEWCILLDPANLTTSSPSKCLGIGSRLI